MKPPGWLETRLEGAPPELAAAVRALVKEVDGEVAGAPTPVDEPAVQPHKRSVPDLLAAAALRGFGDVLAETAQPPARRAALRLLAADAALTYAFEAAADLEMDVVGLADRVGPLGALGTLLESATPGSDEPRGPGPRDPRPDESPGGSP